MAHIQNGGTRKNLGNRKKIYLYCQQIVLFRGHGDFCSFISISFQVSNETFSLNFSALRFSFNSSQIFVFAAQELVQHYDLIDDEKK